MISFLPENEKEPENRGVCPVLRLFRSHIDFLLAMEWLSPVQHAPALSIGIPQTVAHVHVRLSGYKKGQLGHAQTSTTANIYAHVIASAEAKAAQTFDRFNDIVAPEEKPPEPEPMVEVKKIG